MKLANLIVVLAFFSSSMGLANELPDLGDVSQVTLTPSQERVIGEHIMYDIRSGRDYLDDPELTYYLNNLGYRLVSVSPDNRQDFEFFVIKEPTLNAFALPGGFIGVHTGLLLATQTESELASVLAHEIGHVAQHHMARILATRTQSTAISLAGLAVAILAARSNSQLSNAAVAVSQAAAVQTQLDYTREYEKEADRIGLQILQKSNMDPRGMTGFFGRLQKSGRLYENNAPEYLRTHPLTTDRIAEIENRVSSLPYRQIPDSLEFKLMQAKLLAAEGTASQAVEIFEDRLGERRHGSRIANRYGLIIALLRADHYARAQNELAILLERAPANAVIENLAAQVYLDAGETETALARYRSGLKRFPNYPALLYGYAETLLRANKVAQASQFVNDQLQIHPNDYRLYQLQAKTYAAQGKELLQHQALAEAYVRRGFLTAAIEQLQIALNNGRQEGDFYQLSIVEARLKQLKEIDAENKEE